MNSGVFRAISDFRLQPPAAKPAWSMHSLVISWLAKVTSQRNITHDGFMAYGRYVRSQELIEDHPALKQVFDGLIKLHGEDAQPAANKLLSYLVGQNTAPQNVGQLVVTARTALRFHSNQAAEELKLLVRCADAGKPPVEA